MEDNLNFIFKMEDNLKVFRKWKTISILFFMEDDLKYLSKMEDNLIFFENGRQPNFLKTVFLIEDNLRLFGKWKTT